MRQIAKLMAAMLVVTCAMTVVPQQSAAQTLWGELEKLVPQTNTWDINFEIWNNTGREVRVEAERWYDHLGYWSGGSYGKRILQPGETAWSVNTSGTHRVRLWIWNSNQRRWVLKDKIYVFSPGPYFMEAYKAGRGDYRLRRW